MNINELIEELERIRKANCEPEVPSFDPGTLEVRIQSEEGTYESEIKSIEQPNDAWLIVAEPNYDLDL